MIARQAIAVPEPAPMPARFARSAPRLNAASCLECGDDFQRAGGHGTFCTPRCRGAWNNRRLQRGAEIYDLLMSLRYERRGAKGVLTALCRAAAAFRDADHTERAGRPSWSSAREVLARRPYLTAKVIIRRKRRDA